jgi:protein TilB
VTEEMIRSRAEHNEGILGTLEELSMHMLHIEKIEHFEKLCKKLKILLLQNNIVPKIGK